MKRLHSISYQETLRSGDNIIIGLIMVACALCYSFLGKDYGYSVYNTDEYRITYMFAHANLIHLGVNLFTYFLLSRYIYGTILSPLCLVIGYLATFGTEMETPTIGLSAVCYAQIGVISTYFYKQQWCKVMIVSCVLMNVIGYFMESMNVYLHIVAFAYSVLITLALKKFI